MNLKTQVFLVIFTIWYFKTTSASNILHLSLVSSPSHQIWNKVLATGLAAKGHNITYISPRTEKKPLNNISFYSCPDVYKGLLEKFDLMDLSANQSPLSMFEFFAQLDDVHCYEYLKCDFLQKLLNYPKDFKFDMLIYDLTTGDCLLPLIDRFNYPPTIQVTPFLLPSYLSYDLDKDLMKSLYVPWWGINSGLNMGFFDRLQSFIYNHLHILYRWYYQEPKLEQMHRKVFGDKMPSFGALKRHFSLMLANTDPILDYPQTLPPNIIAVGGLHTGRTNEEIPNDLLKILDDAKDGVILFSLGTNFLSSDLTQERKDALLGAFSKLKQIVIWKYEAELDNLPKNVIIRKWLPQSAILGHPNVKLFIGHGGALSTQEAVYNGVPVILIPFLVDQNTNAQIMIERKLGERIDLGLMTVEYVLEKIYKVLLDPTYTKNMKERSRQFRDKPQTPLQTAIFWIEFLIRHGHGKFLETPTRDMSFIQSSGLDVLGFILLILVSALIVIFKLVALVWGLFKPKRKVKTS